MFKNHSVGEKRIIHIEVRLDDILVALQNPILCLF